MVVSTGDRVLLETQHYLWLRNTEAFATKLYDYGAPYVFHLVKPLPSGPRTPNSWMNSATPPMLMPLQRNLPPQSCHAPSARVPFTGWPYSVQILQLFAFIIPPGDTLSPPSELLKFAHVHQSATAEIPMYTSAHTLRKLLDIAKLSCTTLANELQEHLYSFTTSLFQPSFFHTPCCSLSKLI